MAANKAQGQGVTIVLVGITVACAGIEAFDSGLGKFLLLVGAVAILASFWRFFQIKPLEGKFSLNPQPAGGKLAGLAVALLGWIIVLFGLHLAPSVGGRMTAAILGIAVTLVGVLFILPTACNKNAIWKP